MRLAENPPRFVRPGLAGVGLFAGLVLALITATASLSASAFSTGKSGSTGNPVTGGSTCAACHGSGANAEVTVAGPTEIAAGETASFTVSVVGDPDLTKGAGFAASTTDLVGTFGVLDDSTQLLNGEITHASPGAPTDGRVDFDFEWTAPAAPGQVSIYVAAVAANLDLLPAGDHVATTEFQVDVTEAVESATPTATPTPTPTETAVASTTAATDPSDSEPTPTPEPTAAQLPTVPDGGPFGFGRTIKVGVEATPAGETQAGDQAQDESELVATGAYSAALTSIGLTGLLLGSALAVAGRRRVPRLR